jgi:hypothetical protein
VFLSRSAIIRYAAPTDKVEISAILTEAAQWREGELLPGRIAADVAEGQFFVVENDGVPTGTGEGKRSRMQRNPYSG